MTTIIIAMFCIFVAAPVIFSLCDDAALSLHNWKSGMAQRNHEQRNAPQGVGKAIVASFALIGLFCLVIL